MGRGLRIAGLLAVLIGLILSIGSHTVQSQADDLERGEYLATIARCMECHSPAEGSAFSGGEVAYQGVTLHAPNLTPHVTGLARWTDEQLRAAITTGLTPEGRQLHPVMPYHYYNRMADADVEAIIAFLRSLEPVDHETGENDPTGLELPAPPGPRAGVTAPDQTDRVAYGEYLTTAVLACGACHTPQPNGSEPEPEVYLYMAGGQPFEGEWGVVYAGNLTPDLETGLGAWNDDDFVLAVMAGELPDGRETLVMPWEAYAALTSDDIQAVLAYLRSLPPIDSPVPLAELNEGYAHYTRDDVPARSSPFMSALAVLVLILLLGLGVLMTIRQYRYARALREMEWRGTFPLTPSDREDEEGDQDQPPPGP